MEPQAEGKTYRVKFTEGAIADLKDIQKGPAAGLLELIKAKLSRAPEYFGEPLKGTKGLIWKLKPGKYRVLYLLGYSETEVHVLAVKNRDHVYRPAQLQTLILKAQSILSGRLP